ncbi:alpha/beta-hydrolase [Microthyrium microscopicum]|uniref:Alpha/beta-hydrolase n=1 Tax=Microthyrium microscopicum TaxID=703497 RepID=A0A6A6UJQ5_9PEZI|nr:alpha/beta-hydrolase [Microthyrium microscopicum]
MASEAPNSKTVHVGHLGGTKVGYVMNRKTLANSKPTVVLIPPFITSTTFFRPQLNDEALGEVANLIAMEPLGHGNTSTRSPCFTAWDSAIAFWQALDSLGVKKVFVLGSSQAGWIAARMALLAPDRVLGLIPVSTTLSANGSHITELGSIDFAGMLTQTISGLSATDANFALPSAIVQGSADLSLGPDGTAADKKLVFEDSNKYYTGDTGRKKFVEASIALITRDCLHLRLDAITCPVLWIRGGEDKIFTEGVAKQDIEHLKNASVTTEVVDGGYHAPTWTHAEKLNGVLLEFIKKHGGKGDARGLREAVGMVDI